METVLITGASGFVGSAVVSRLIIHPAFTPRSAMRRISHLRSSSIDVIQIGDLTSSTDWSTALLGIDAVIHLAARVHVLKEVSSEPLDAFRKINVEGTLNLARQAVSAGVKRFVFISSIGVNGNQNESPFTEVDIEAPVEPYAISKMEAERGLRRLADESGMEVVIIRPPLVYGPNAPGNFGRLIRAIDKGIPFPLGAIQNKRSLVALDNLVALIVTCIDHPAAANQTFLAGDGEDLSTPELLRRMANAMGISARLISVPVPVLKLGSSLICKPTLIPRLCDSLQVDISKTEELLDWKPPISVDQGLERAAEGFNHYFEGPTKLMNWLIRWFDIIFSFVGLVTFFPLLLLIALIGLFDTGRPIFFQNRIGKCRHSFVLVKFRTMHRSTVSVASHLAYGDAVTSWGRFLRVTKLDELPQLWNVLIGEMSLVGPRPCLVSQHELIVERTRREVFNVRPGITGLAQIKGIDMSTPKLLAEIDAQMIQTMTVKTYFSCIFKTILGQGRGDRIGK